MKTIDFNNFVERYLDNAMEAAEKAWFEKELSGNATLREELKLRRKTDEILLKSDLQSLRSKLTRISAEHSRKSSKHVQHKLLKYAAMVAILVMTGSAIYFPNRKLGNEELFNQYFSIAPVAIESVSRSAEAYPDNDFMLAVDNYRNGDYESAIDHFMQYTLLNQGYPELYMMIGNSYAEMEQYNEAGSSYRKVIDHNNNLYIEDATWLLGLCYLKTGDNNKARQQMALIASSESRYSKDAAVIVRRMKK
jgi:tetratricopeptide (TPR) repeat protein